jgi:aminopeptidase N
VAVPNGLVNVSNGRLLGSQDLKNGYTRWDWEIKNPINNYDITVNIADYVHFGENYKGLDLDYYVLRDNETKARKHFELVKPMMDCFQSRFGHYPLKRMVTNSWKRHTWAWNTKVPWPMATITRTAIWAMTCRAAALG